MADADDGLYLEPDTSPYTGTTLTTGDSTSAEIVDANLYDAVSEGWYQDNAYGIDLGSSMEVGKLRVTCFVPPAF